VAIRFDEENKVSVMSISLEMPAAPKLDLDKANIRRVVISSWVGNTIEYYDFLLYGLASALVFGKIFFPILARLPHCWPLLQPLA
jgi:hypothetical protein